MNDKFINWIGKEPVGEFCYEILHERDSICPWCVNDRVFAGETVRWEVQSPKDGRWYYAVNVPIYNADGSISKQAMILDITERKQIETELQNKNRELESFTYTVSHDLKSPLITIKGFAGAVCSDLAAGRGDRIEKDLMRIGNAADKMMDLLDDLLQLSRIGRVINPPEPVDMTDLANEVVDSMAPIFLENGAQVVVQAELPTVFCDRQRISVVLQNLVENAVQYRGQQTDLLIQIGLREEGIRPVFFVRDNGAGIASEYHQQIFGLFNRLNVKVPGNGIGLSLVKRIIEEHGGRVWVESEGESTGSTFCFSLG
jgi:light-regulated signal transduction histidine kinase (bacteriophytochrome)